MKKLLAIMLFSALAFAQSTPAPATDKTEKKAEAKKEMKCDADMKCCEKMKDGKHAGKHEGKAEGHDKHAKDGKTEHAKMDCCKDHEGKEGSMCARKPMKEEKKAEKKT